MRTVISALNGQAIPATININISPLRVVEYKKDERTSFPVPYKTVAITASGRQVMNDEWIYIDAPGHGPVAINVNRANYCRKKYLINVRIADSFKGRMTGRLRRFIENVADTLVFERNGITYQVYLVNHRGWFDVKKVVKYWQANGTGGVMRPWFAIEKKYGTARVSETAVDLSIFNFNE